MSLFEHFPYLFFKLLVNTIYLQVIYCHYTWQTWMGWKMRWTKVIFTHGQKVWNTVTTEYHIDLFSSFFSILFFEFSSSRDSHLLSALSSKKKKNKKLFNPVSRSTNYYHQYFNYCISVLSRMKYMETTKSLLMCLNKWHFIIEKLR